MPGATMATLTRPRVAVVNDYDVVVAGLAAILEPYSDRVELVDAIKLDGPIEDTIDIALLDTFGRQGVEDGALQRLLERTEVSCVAVYSFNLEPEAVRQALAAGAAGYLSKATPARDLVDQINRIAAGERVVSGAGSVDRSCGDDRGWPGRELGLSEREAEVVALAALGRRNSEIAAALYVSVDTVKTHLARSFRKLGVHNRTELSALIHRRPSFRRFLPDF